MRFVPHLLNTIKSSVGLVKCPEECFATLQKFDGESAHLNPWQNHGLLFEKPGFVSVYWYQEHMAGMLHVKRKIFQPVKSQD